MYNHLRNDSSQTSFQNESPFYKKTISTIQMNYPLEKILTVIIYNTDTEDSLFSLTIIIKIN